MSRSTEALEAVAGFEGAAEIIAAWRAGMAPEHAMPVGPVRDQQRRLRCHAGAPGRDDLRRALEAGPHRLQTLLDQRLRIHLAERNGVRVAVD